MMSSEFIYFPPRTLTPCYGNEETHYGGCLVARCVCAVALCVRRAVAHTPDNRADMHSHIIKREYPVAARRSALGTHTRGHAYQLVEL
jgi:hypothetical protein